MIDPDLDSYLREKQWKTKQRGNQIIVESECPFCGKSGHLYINAETTQWDCKRCGETGNLLTMKRRLGDLTFKIRGAADLIQFGPKDRVEVPQDIVDKCWNRLFAPIGKRTLDYIRSRGFNDATIGNYKLGCSIRGGKHWLLIPHFHGARIANVKMRSVPPDEKTFRRWKGAETILFNGWKLDGLKREDPKNRRVWICEGELDAIAIDQLLSGTGERFVVASTAGASVKWREDWLAPLEYANEILIAYDADSAGENGAKQLASVLGKHRCKRVVPPEGIHDWADFLKAGFSQGQLLECAASAKPYAETSVRPTSDFIGQLLDALDNPQPRGQSTGWITLDAIWGGVRPGELTVVTGDTGTGKSTFTTAFARNQALQGTPVLIAPFEQQPSEILGKLVSMEAGRSIYAMDRNELEATIQSVVSQPVYFLDKRGVTPLVEIKDAIRYAVQFLGVRFVVLDHLHFFLEMKLDQERQAIDNAMRQLKVLADEVGIHLVLVVHPSKLGQGFKGRTRRVTLDDLKGSSEIKKVADNGIRVYRERKDGVGSKHDDTEIAVLKCRSPAGAEGAITLHFDGQSERYVESTLGMGSDLSTPTDDEDLEVFEEETEFNGWNN